MFFLFLKNSILGSFVVVSVKPVKVHRDALTSFENLDFGVLETIVEGLGLPDLQFALYQCDQEGQAGDYILAIPKPDPPIFPYPFPSSSKTGKTFCVLVAALESRPGLD